ncbi:HEXXH motif domain-containing protein [Frankia sp. Cpl3]|nr:HEXXH motif domain-containing protein [Frankia sp. Cpl3]
MNEAHRLARADFDALATGGGGPSTLAALWQMQLSRRILLVHLFAEVSRRQEPQTFAEGGFPDALTVLAETRRKAPEAAAAVLLDPQVGGWIMHCLRLMLGPTGQQASAGPDLGHFGAVAAAAAWRAGLTFETTVSVRDGSVMIPTVGLFRTEAANGWGRAQAHAPAGTLRIICGDETVSVPDSSRSEESSAEGNVSGLTGWAHWLPLRQLRSTVDGRSLRVVLDDLDPFRGFAGLRNAQRLAPAEIMGWNARLDEAWELLVRHLPKQADAVAAGVRCLVPLDPDPMARKLSATSADAPGAVGLSPAADGLELATALVHELQHTKLAALQDAVRLCEPGGDLHYAPWRSDPRPLSGMFQGVYAYLGLTEFWGTYRRTAEEPWLWLAHFEFARWREAVRRVLGELRSSAYLTALGRDFLAGMTTSTARWCAEAVPALPRGLARVAAAEHWTSWRLRNVDVDQGWVSLAADAWLAGRPGPDWRTASGAVRGAPRGEIRSPYLSLAHLLLREPDRFAALRRDLHDPDLPLSAVPGASTADLLLIAGDRRAARNAYLREIAHTPERTEAWAGLTLAHRTMHTAAQRVLIARPETICTLHRCLRERTGAGPDPEALAGWLDAQAHE